MSKGGAFALGVGVTLLIVGLLVWYIVATDERERAELAGPSLRVVPSPQPPDAAEPQ